MRCASAVVAEQLDGVVGGIGDLAADTAVAVDAGHQLDGDGLADGAAVVRRRAQATLETGARDLEGVAARHRVVGIERARHQPGDLGQAVEIDPVVALDGHAQGAAVEFDVVEAQPERIDDLCHQLGDGVDDAHGCPPL